MGRREEAPVAEAAAADPGAAAAVAAAGDDDDDGEEGGDGGDVDAHSCPPDTENHCRSQVVPALRTPRSPPPADRAY